MNTFRFRVTALLLLPLAGCKEPPISHGRYQLVRANAAGMMFKIDTVTGNTWRIMPTGEQTLICPPGPIFPLEDVKGMHAALVKSGTTKLSLRDWALEQKRATNSSIMDAVLMEPEPGQRGK